MSDVPGYSWGTVIAMSQAGIRYVPARLTSSIASAHLWRHGRIGLSGGLSLGPRKDSDVDSHGLVTRSRTLPRSSTKSGSEDIRTVSTKLSTLMTSPTFAGQAMEIMPRPIQRYATLFATGMPSMSGLVSQSRLPVRRFPPLKRDTAIICPPIAATWPPYWEDGAGSWRARDSDEQKRRRPAHPGCHAGIHAGARKL